MEKFNKTGVYIILIICLVKIYKRSAIDYYKNQSYGQFVPLDTDNLNVEFYD